MQNKKPTNKAKTHKKIEAKKKDVFNVQVTHQNKKNNQANEYNLRHTSDKFSLLMKITFGYACTKSGIKQLFSIYFMC